MNTSTSFVWAALSWASRAIETDAKGWWLIVRALAPVHPTSVLGTESLNGST